MKVWRVEDDEGYGPWASKQDLGWFAEGPNGHPGPLTEPTLRDTRERWQTPGWFGGIYRFGCRTKEELFGWWQGVVLGQHLKVAVYEVPDGDVIEGDTQCVYRKDSAVLVETHPVSIFLEEVLV